MTEPIQEAGLWIYKMFITFVVAVVLLGIVGSTLKADVNTIEVQKDLFVSRILYSPDSFWYQDTHGTLYPGVVNKALFTPSRMAENFQYPQGYGGAKLSLVQGTQEQTIYINQPSFENFKKQAQQGIKHGGTVETHSYPVLIKTEQGEEKGYLVIEVAMPSRT